MLSMSNRWLSFEKSLCRLLRPRVARRRMVGSRVGVTEAPRQIHVEGLEERCLLSWSSVPPAAYSVYTIGQTESRVGLNSQADYSTNASISYGEIDWYGFTATRTGSYRIDATTPYSNLDTVLAIYDSAGNRGPYSDDAPGLGRDSRITVNLVAGNTYHVGVTNYQGTSGGSYSLVIDGPNGVTTASRTLYIDFDGISLSRNDLTRFANGQWNVNNLDRDGNGIQVGRFIGNRADREQVINTILTMVNADLQAFGVRAVRTTNVVENIGASTMLVGPTFESSVSGNVLGRASDVDRGNDNRTDIALLPGSSTWNNLSVSALAVRQADLILHEAGHTWGLAHVLAGQTREAMSNDRGGDIGNNLSFVNQSFRLQESVGTQNSFEVMYRTFVTLNGGVLGQRSSPAFELQGLQKVETTFAIVNQASSASVVSAPQGLIQLSGTGLLENLQRLAELPSATTRTNELFSTPSSAANSLARQSPASARVAAEIDQTFTSLTSGHVFQSLLV